jgi:hypothetical protein
LLTIVATVELTLKPSPLVGDPKLKPTIPIATSIGDSSSLRTNRHRGELGKTYRPELHNFNAAKAFRKLRRPADA